MCIQMGLLPPLESGQALGLLLLIQCGRSIVFTVSSLDLRELGDFQIPLSQNTSELLHKKFNKADTPVEGLHGKWRGRVQPLVSHTCVPDI